MNFIDFRRVTHHFRVGTSENDQSHHSMAGQSALRTNGNLGIPDLSGTEA